MTTETARDRIEAVLVKAGDELRAGKKVKVFEFKEQEADQYATRITWWPPRKGESKPPELVLGQRYAVTFDKKPTGDEGKFYRDFVEAVPAHAAASPGPHTAPGAQEPRHEAPGAGNGHPGTQPVPFRSPAQIIRGEAFGLALHRWEVILADSKAEEPEVPLTMLAQDALYIAYVIERGKLPPREPNYQKPPRTPEPEPQEEQEAPQ